MLILDNFEHLLAAAPGLGELLAACPAACLLVTSRAGLRLPGEHEVLVAPLGLPPKAHAGSPADLAYPATTLFVERARALRPGIAIDAATGLDIGEICRRLDGVPLAIELAAARVRHLPIATIREQLGNRLDLLVGGWRSAPQRQHTMRAAIAWSYELLSDEQRALFRRLAIFAGGWSLAAADAVGGPGAGPAQVAELVDQSLVQLDEDDPQPRYRMLDVIREYAAELARAHGDADLGRRHSQFFLGLAEAGAPQLTGPAQDAWYRLLDLDYDNLCAALGWSIEQEDAETALRLGGALWQFWRQHGDFAEGREWLRRALAMAPAGPPATRLPALWGAAWMAYGQGDLDAMDAISQEHLALAREQADPAALRHALTERGMVTHARGQVEAALPHFREALEIGRDLGQPWILGVSLFNLGWSTMHAGDLAGATELIDEARRLFEGLGDRRFEARARGELAFAALLEDRPERARELFRQSLATFAQLGESQGIAEGLEGLAAISAALGEPERAARLAGAAEALRETSSTEASPYDRTLTERFLDRGRALAGGPGWTAAWARGRTMPLEAALADALAQPPTR